MTVASFPSLFDVPIDPTAPIGHVGPPEPLTIYEAFMAFHARNPQVYRELVALARRLRKRGVTVMGISMLYEVLRYRQAVRSEGDAFKLNNSYRSYYARLILLDNPDLAGMLRDLAPKSLYDVRLAAKKAATKAARPARKPREKK